MGNSFVLFDVSAVISHGQFHCGNRGHTRNTDFPGVKFDFPVGRVLLHLIAIKLLVSVVSLDFVLNNCFFFIILIIFMKRKTWKRL